MARGVYSFCPRDSMPTATMNPTVPTLPLPIDTSTKQANDAMTWQQREDFGHAAKPSERRSSRVQWAPFDPAAIESPPTIAAEEGKTWAAQLAEFPIPDPRRNPRAKAATSASPRHANPPTPTIPSPPENDTQKPEKSSHTRPPRKSKKQETRNNMSALPKSAYIPPHLRKRGSATPAKADSVLGLHTANGSPAVSDKSKTEHPAQLDSSPNSANQSPNSPPSPATTPPESEKVENNGWAGWDNPKPESSPLIRKAENPRWPRGPKPAPKKTVWPKARDMKYIPTDSDSDGGVSFRSNSNGDPHYDVKQLMDWNGDWLPPPEQWSARKGYSNRHFGQIMEQWMNGHSIECIDSMDISSDSFRGRQTTNGDEVEHVLVDGVCKELVPRYWLLAHIEGKPLREFWKEMPLRAPEALDDTDITAEPPWWDLYTDASSSFISALVVPDAKVDGADVANHINPFGFASATERMRNKRERDINKQQRMLAKRNRPLPEPKFPVPEMEDRRIRPSANVYLRPVQPADVRGIAEIYNYYVENSIAANEFDGRTEAQIRDRINGITEAGLPYLVAIARGNQPRGGGYIREKIVGYINLDDYCDQSSMYRFTFEMELFVHPGYLMKGIAKCLLDRLLEMANTGYNARGGYEYVNEFDYLKTGPSRVIKTILLNVHHQHGADIQWATDYLSAFKFVRAGRISQVGFKKDQIVDVSIYQHHTTETINPGSIPTVPLERN
ncbi:uncharacterized protein K460DRAFT_317343 [Cucurbitaria berberidis CBS 394.84]|uniref:N-acetyltransferase domain-containing protein n=1 Tax=Cucurbitaria berberidis CBS 394.84 TaxID=1168544 RepID=A0A9P4GEL6_9PLEO|nr:uncharacterized protein K460DRAFT_317343 [Cucurbitaria berberidis CBS 394.84]KAF1844140.1 hypothetical protein K460DRAFT_317343 [Cucurbitaria berberidis CBS 394.84]